MITVTPAAAKQIKASAKESGMQNPALRIAARRKSDGAIEYGMGFDDTGRDEDLTFKSEGVSLVMDPICVDLLKDTVLDYVEMEPGEYRFIFMNPNDPHYRPPEGGAAPPSDSRGTWSPEK
ncbi:HesB/IscA family protein [Thioalkalivibrio thiocyanodenitrificans]|uniref:HesB/IscA family protein n=1 Tax=Thioalkalivibrio thiocyanodenitrificans TaxID=243063 RepID=UPI00035F8307|nr:iron-sulfur cluster assembly accessory protein [Thioalkalivibrio thiocyanodenitrificans]